MKNPRASVIVCTRNRAALLRVCLESILEADWPFAERVEVLAVDNGSTDATPQVAAELAGRDARLRYLREDRPGKSNALNRGIAESRSDLLLFTDDDARVERGWLVAMMRASETIPAEGYGGRVVAEWECPVPEWVPRLPSGKPYGGAIVEHDHGEEPVRYELGKPGYPLGANAAFRRRVFETVGGYHTDLGLSGRSRIGGQDTDLARRALEAGMTIVYVPDAVVFHPVLMDRLTKRYFRQWFYSHARGDMMATDRWKREAAILGLPRKDVVGLAQSALRLGARSIIGERHEAFAEQCCFLVHLGHVLEAMRRRRERGSRGSKAVPPRCEGGGAQAE